MDAIRTLNRNMNDDYWWKRQSWGKRFILLWLSFLGVLIAIVGIPTFVFATMVWAFRWDEFAGWCVAVFWMCGVFALFATGD